MRYLKALIRVAGLIVVLNFANSVNAALGPNLIPGNCNFEGTTVGDTVQFQSRPFIDWWWASPGEGKLEIARENCPEDFGFRALYLENPKAGTEIGISKFIGNLKPNTRYQLSLWIKTDPYYLTGGVMLGADIFGKNGWAGRKATYNNHAQEWTLITFTFALESDQTAISVQVGMVGACKGWVDNVKLQEVDEMPPGVPREVVAVRTQQAKTVVDISWKAPTPAADGDVAVSYNIYRGADPSHVNLIKSGIRGNSWRDEKVPRDTLYYLVRAVDKVGNESTNTEAIYVPGIANIHGQVTLNNRPVNNAEIFLDGSFITHTDDNGNYEIEVPEGEHILKASLVGYRFEEQRVSCLALEEYILNFIGETDQVPPNPPTLLGLQANKGYIKINWAPPSPAPDGEVALAYNLYRGETPTNLVLYADKIVGTEWEDIKVKSEQTYYYALTALDKAGNESEKSQVLAVKSIICPGPVLLEPRPGEKIVDSPVCFSWDNQDSGVTYLLEVAKDPTFAQDVHLYSNISGNNWVISREVPAEGSILKLGLPTGKWYWRVKAIFPNGAQSSYSEVGNFYTVVTKLGTELRSPFLAIHPSVLGPDTPEGKVKIYFLTTATEHVTARIFAPNGSLVRTLLDATLSLGDQELLWDGKDERGRLVRNGIYIVEILGKDTQWRIRKKIAVLR